MRLILSQIPLGQRFLQDARTILAVLDQAEEAFTATEPEHIDEARAFFDALAEIFGVPVDDRPQGKLIEVVR